MALTEPRVYTQGGGGGGDGNIHIPLLLVSLGKIQNKPVPHKPNLAMSSQQDQEEIQNKPEEPMPHEPNLVMSSQQDKEERQSFSGFMDSTGSEYGSRLSQQEKRRIDSQDSIHMFSHSQQERGQKLYGSMQSQFMLPQQLERQPIYRLTPTSSTNSSCSVFPLQEYGWQNGPSDLGFIQQEGGFFRRSEQTLPHRLHLHSSSESLVSIDVGANQNITYRIPASVSPDSQCSSDSSGSQDEQCMCDAC